MLKLQVSIPLESNQPYSEFVTTMAGKLGNSTLLLYYFSLCMLSENNDFGKVCDMVTCSNVNSCSRERGTAIGAVALLMVIIAVIIISLF